MAKALPESSSVRNILWQNYWYVLDHCLKQNDIVGSDGRSSVGSSGRNSVGSDGRSSVGSGGRNSVGSVIE